MSDTAGVRNRGTEPPLENAQRQCGKALVAGVQSKTEKLNKEQYQKISTKDMS